MDIAHFQVIRPPATPANDDVVRLTKKRMIGVPNRELTVMVDPGAAAAGGISLLEFDNIPKTLATGREDPLNRAPQSDASQLQRVYMLLLHLSSRLMEVRERMTGKALFEEATAAAKALGIDFDLWQSSLGGGPVRLREIAQVALLALRRPLVRAMTVTRDLQRAAELTRLVLVAALFERDPDVLLNMAQDDVRMALARRSVVLSEVEAETMLPGAKVELIREAKTADLNVVRREWEEYVLGEIAQIRNVMTGESFKLSEKSVVERETITTGTQETTQVAEREDESKLVSEFSQEVSSQLAVEVNGYANASAEFKYPVATVSISGGVDARVAMQRSEERASKVAQEAVSRAVSRMETRTREERTRRELLRTEQASEYALEASGAGNRHGIYRWVDRIDRYQMFRYPNRFLLEFQIPEPAEFYRFRALRQQSAKRAAQAPPPFDVKLEDIVPERLLTLASKYRATNLPAPPDPKVSVIQTVIATLGEQALPKNGDTTNWNMPAAVKEVEITLPPGYIATSVHYSGEGYPVRGDFRLNQGKPDEEGRHAAIATVAIGQVVRTYWNGGYRNVGGGLEYLATFGENRDLGSIEVVQFSDPPFGRAFLPIGRDGDLNPKPAVIDLKRPPEAAEDLPGAPDRLTISLNTVGLASCVLAVQVQCERSEQSLLEWKLSVFDVLQQAWMQWQRDYDRAQSAATLRGDTGLDAGGSLRNEQTIREELKRSVLAWLLNEEGFAGRNALRERPRKDAADPNSPEKDFADPDFGAVRDAAPTIQFLEQAFEWTNLSYVFYPYFWASRLDGHWEHLASLTSGDAEFERFLRAGSARVIVPARPGFEEPVKNWLYHQVPFMDGRLPTPDSELYISVDREIRDLTAPVRDGIAGQTWRSRMGTTFIYLEADLDLPLANPMKQLPLAAGTVLVE